ncbi:MAG: sigma factor, partial [Actinomycetota bacterium]|nr:sigma factor [Actinomycetota bacterium]
MTDIREAFVVLYERTHADMVRLAFLMTGSAETAQDLVQDSFVRLHQAWRRVREAEWYLRRSVVNACNSHHRRVARQRKLPAERPRVASLEADEISDALMQLPARQRSAIVLRYWHDRTTRRPRRSRHSGRCRAPEAAAHGGDRFGRRRHRRARGDGGTRDGVGRRRR